MAIENSLDQFSDEEITILKPLIDSINYFCTNKSPEVNNLAIANLQAENLSLNSNPKIRDFAKKISEKIKPFI